MYLPYCACLTSRGISTRRVLFILSLVTTPVSTRRLPRSASVAIFLRSLGRRGRLLRFCLGQLALAQDGLNPGSLALRLADFARRLQPLGRRLEAEVEEVLGDLLERELKLL